MGWDIRYYDYPAVVAPGPAWTGVPSFAATEGAVVAFPLPVDVSDGSVITVQWMQPLPQPSWVLLASGTDPTITFQGNQQDANDLSNVVIRATANGQYADSGYGSITINAAPPASWDVGSPSFTVGSGGTFSVTGPSGYATGGVYDVDVQGTALPSGMSLSAAGVLSVGTATVGATGVVFGYTEPGALPTLTLHGTGTDVPWMATAYPAEGAVPSGMLVESADDTNLKASVLSTWPDGSAQVMVLAGQTTVSGTKTISLRPAVVSQTPLTTSAIAAAISSVAVNFGTAYTLSDFSAPDWIWWQNAQVICARYRIPILNRSQMEAVIDIHAFAGGRAFVEVVIENAKVNVSSPSIPTAQTYSGATVAVNGTTIATVSSSSNPDPNAAGQHTPLRAWYASTWVGGDPGIEVTHDTVSTQAHPLFFEPSAVSSVNLQATYQSDAYTPWYAGRYRAGMGGVGDASMIGPLPLWEAQYLQSGDKYARRAVLASALGALTWSINWRDQATGLVPSATQVSGKTVQNGTWPGYNPIGQPANYRWEVAHQPAVGLMAFLCRPSPCFLELAQKVALVNYTADSAANGRLGPYFAGRGKAWGFRNVAHAAFLTPDAQTALKAGAKANLAFNVSYIAGLYVGAAEDKLNVIWDSDPDYGYLYRDFANRTADGVAMQQPRWFHDFAAPEFHKARDAKVLTGADQAALDTLADWMLVGAARWVNDQSAGGWRYIPYQTTFGTADGSNSVTMGQQATWQATRAARITDLPASVSGTWMTAGNAAEPASFASGWTIENGNSGYIYVGPFWTALCAAVERGVTGAETAWATVTANVTNLTTFKAHGGTDPRHHAYPRNK